jgi:DNA-binding IclR family transcriptional regulator
LTAAWTQHAGAAEVPERPDLAHEGDRKFVGALARGLEVLRAFRPRDGFLTNSEIAARTGLPKPTVTRLTYTLCELGYLRLNPRLGKYQLAGAAITLGYAALSNTGVRHVGQPFMDEAAAVLKAPVALGVLDRDRALYLHIARGPASFTVQLDVGSRIPLAVTAMGRALLVTLDEAEREAQLAAFAERHPRSEATLRKAMAQSLREYQEHGFVTSGGEWKNDIFAAGAPLVAADGSGTYAFNCGGPPFHFPRERLYREVGPVVRALAAVVDASLNGDRTARPGGEWLPKSPAGAASAAG